MPARKGKCIQFGLCPRADNKEVIEIQAGQEFVCPEPCGKPLQEIVQRGEGPPKWALVAAAVVVVALSAVGGYWYMLRPGEDRTYPVFNGSAPALPSNLSPVPTAAVGAPTAIPPESCGLKVVQSPDVNRILTYLKQGVNYASQGKYGDAILEFTQIRQIDPNFLAMRENVAGAEIKLKRWADASTELDDELKLIGCLDQMSDEALAPFAYMIESNAEAAGVGPARARAMRTRLQQARAVAHYNRACLQSAQGKTADAVAELHEAVKNGFVDVAALKRDPDLVAVRGDAAFKGVIEAASNQRQ